MAKKQEKMYLVELGYRELCVGTLPQCQRVQSALAACQIVEARLLDEVGEQDRRVVLVESEKGAIVKPTKKRVFTQEEYERENILKIGMTPAELVKGGVV